MLAAENWCINVEGKVYGPYSTEQMAGFAREGRLVGRSMVSPAGGNTWRPASQIPTLHSLITGEKTADRTFGKSTVPQTPDAVPEGAVANLIVIFDPVIGTAGRVEQHLKELGTAFRLTSNVWVVTTSQSAHGVKNSLSPHLDVREPIFVVDCTRGRTAWQNFVPEIAARLTKAWVRTDRSAA